MIKEFPIKLIENTLDFICSSLSEADLENFLLNLKENSRFKEISNASRFSSILCDSHPFIEMVISLKGENYLKVEEEFIRFKPFQFYIINRKLPHQLFWKKKKNESQMLWISFVQEKIRFGLSTYKGNNYTKTWGKDLDAPGNYLVEKILFEIDQKAYLYKKAIISYSNTLFFSISRNLDFIKKNNKNLGLKLTKEVEEYIKTHLNAHPSIFELSQITKTNKTYLCKTFKEMTGISITEYIRKEKIKQATRLLITTNDTVASISEKLGYYDQFHFCKAFKTVMKISPLQFRKALPNEQLEKLNKK